MLWIFFAIAAPALYAASNFVDKYIIGKHVKNFVTLTILGGFVALPFSLIIFMVRGFPVYSLGQTILIILAGVCMELTLLPYYKAISLDEVSRVVPVFQLIPVLVLMLSFVFLGERLNMSQFIGFIFVVAGAYLVSLNAFGRGYVQFAEIIWLDHARECHVGYFSRHLQIRVG